MSGSNFPLVVTTTLQVAQGQTFALSDTSLVLGNIDPTSSTVLSVAGLLTRSFAADNVTGVEASSGLTQQIFRIEPTGVLHVGNETSTSASFAIGYFVGRDGGPSFENSGLLEVISAHGFATGVTSWDADGRFVNYGAIRVTALLTATGLDLANLVSPSGFQNFGVLDVRDEGADPLGNSVGVVLWGAASWFRNEAGASITVAHLAGNGGATVGVSIHADGFTGTANDTYVNAGLIKADRALIFGQEYDPSRVEHGRVFHNEPTGVLWGQVQLTGTGIVLDNAGLVDGSVVMGDGDEVYDGGRGGTVSGMVSGGEGADQLFGGPNHDSFQGNQGADQEFGGGGDDWVIGGKDNDRLFGQDGNDIINGNIGDDRCDGGSGDDVVRGGQGNDVLEGGDGADLLFGDRGDDTLNGGAGADTFNAFSGAGVDVVVDFKAWQGDRVHIDAGTEYVVAQQGADTVISLASGGRMVLAGISATSLQPGWIFS